MLSCALVSFRGTIGNDQSVVSEHRYGVLELMPAAITLGTRQNEHSLTLGTRESIVSRSSEFRLKALCYCQFG